MQRFVKFGSWMIVVVFTVVSMLAFVSKPEVALEKKPYSQKGKAIIVKYKDSLNIMKDGVKGSTLRQEIKGKLNLSKLDLKRIGKYSNMETLEIDVNDDVEKTLNEFRKNPDVDYAQPNMQVFASSIPSEPRFNEQWGLLNNGQKISGVDGKKGIDVNIDKAWDLTKGSSNVVVGILDTGIDGTHPELKDRMFVNTKEVAGNSKDDDANGYINDITGWDFANEDPSTFDNSTQDTHGTEVAGVIAASLNNQGIVGVAPQVKILPLKFMNGDSGYTSDLIEAIEYAKTMGIKIVNCSFGSTQYNPALKETMKNSGMLFICAAGNNGDSVPVYPACFDLPNIISVASVGNDGRRSNTSNFGQETDVAAPGVKILTTMPGNTYGYVSGTSFAAPFATGLAALLASYKPEMTTTDIKTTILSNVTKIPELKDYIVTQGIINAAQALQNIKLKTTDPTEVANDPKTTYSPNTLMKTLADIPQNLIEQIHYGEDGVNPASGNFSRSYTDMVIPSAGMEIRIGRTYNSRSTGTEGGMYQFWNFSYIGYIESQGYDTTLRRIVHMPDGSAQVFDYVGTGVDERSGNSTRNYQGNGTKSTYVEYISVGDVKYDQDYISQIPNQVIWAKLTTKDQMQYMFDANYRLVRIHDRNGNFIRIDFDSDMQWTIRNNAGSKCIVNLENYMTGKYRITEVTDSATNRKVFYGYKDNTTNDTLHLYEVKDSMGNTSWIYKENSAGGMNGSYFYGQRQEVFTYEEMAADNTYKVKTYRVKTHLDRYGNQYTYDYQTTTLPYTTTITDLNGKKITKTYDIYMRVTNTKIEKGSEVYSASVEYECNTDFTPNINGEEKTITDWSGNKTTFIRDVNGNGNIEVIVNPNGSMKNYTYDKYNSVTSEVDESNNRIDYLYDENGNLRKKAERLDGTNIAFLEGRDESKYAITEYKYYYPLENGYKVRGLLKSITDPVQYDKSIVKKVSELKNGDRILIQSRNAAIQADGKRWLEALTYQSTVGMSFLSEGLNGTTVWEVYKDANGNFSFKSIGPTEVTRWLEGRKAESKVALVPSSDGTYTGTKWEVSTMEDGIFQFQCLGSGDGNSWLSGGNGDGVVELVRAPGSLSTVTGANWNIYKSNRRETTYEYYANDKNSNEYYTNSRVKSITEVGSSSWDLCYQWRDI